MTARPPSISIRRNAGPYGYERALQRKGFAPIAGVDEAGRGACAGPLVAAAVILDRTVDGVTDSKLLTPQRRDELCVAIKRRARAVSVLSVGPGECDRMGMHHANIEALRRAIARLPVAVGYVLTDGFAVDGLGAPALAMRKGDRVSASISAASIVAKVARDEIMNDLHGEFPVYDFATHKGYVTDAHQRALTAYGPCAQHRKSYVNVQRESR